MFEDFIEKHPLTDFEFLVAQRSQRRLRDRDFFRREVWSSYLQTNEQLANILKDLCDRCKIPHDHALANLRAFEKISHEVGFWSGREFTLYKAEWLGKSAAMEASSPQEPDEQAKASAMKVMKAEENAAIDQDAKEEKSAKEMIEYLDSRISESYKTKQAKATTKKANKKSGAKVKKDKSVTTKGKKSSGAKVKKDKPAKQATSKKGAANANKLKELTKKIMAKDPVNEAKKAVMKLRKEAKLKKETIKTNKKRK